MYAFVAVIFVLTSNSVGHIFNRRAPAIGEQKVEPQVAPTTVSKYLPVKSSSLVELNFDPTTARGFEAESLFFTIQAPAPAVAYPTGTFIRVAVNIKWNFIKTQVKVVDIL